MNLHLFYQPTFLFCYWKWIRKNILILYLARAECFSLAKCRHILVPLVHIILLELFRFPHLLLILVFNLVYFSFCLQTVFKPPTVVSFHLVHTSRAQRAVEERLKWECKIRKYPEVTWEKDWALDILSFLRFQNQATIWSPPRTPID